MSEVKATGQLKVCGCGKCRQIWNIDDQTLIAVAMFAGDTDYTEGEGYTHEKALANADEIALRWNAHNSLVARNELQTETLTAVCDHLEFIVMLAHENELTKWNISATVRLLVAARAALAEDKEQADGR